MHPTAAAFLAGLCTWATTAFGASLVFLGGSWIKARAMDFVYGSSAGVMLAASFFSLLGPSVAIAKELKWPVWLPAVVGFIIGIVVIKFADWLLPENAATSPFFRCFIESGVDTTETSLTELDGELPDRDRSRSSQMPDSSSLDYQEYDRAYSSSNKADPEGQDSAMVSLEEEPITVGNRSQHRSPAAVKNLILLVLAISLHNFPEGLAMGFAFGGVKVTGEAYTLNEAIMLAVALGIQNIPEGMAISIPLHRNGMSKRRAFLIGQFSGAVEVIAAVLGSAFSLLLTSTLPFCLSFAAGAMMYVVLSDMLPQSTQTESKFGLYGCLAGFILMMALDTGFS